MKFTKSEVTDRTIINNKITTLTTNNNSYSLSPEGEQTSMECYASSSGLASRPGLPQLSPVGSLAASKTETLIDSTIPENWDYIKLDLFNNATITDLAKNKNKFKLAISIKLKNREGWMKFRCLLNSPFRNLKRGLDTETYENLHYTNVKKSYKVLKDIYKNVRASKVYELGFRSKGQSVEDLSIILVPTDKDGEYLVNLHFQEQQWLWKLSNSLTQSQRNGNMIASIGVRRGNKTKNLKAGDLLG